MNACVGTAEIYYETTGAGPPLLLLHGNGESCEIFAPLLGPLSERFTVIAMDSRGHGRSSHGEGELSLLKMASDAAGLLDELGYESAHILGFSDGGNVAMLLASLSPARARSLVLSGANAYPSGLRLKYLFPMWLSQTECTIKSVFSMEACRRKEFLDLMVKEPNLRAADLERIGCHTLITAGEDDMVSASHTLWLHRHIKGSELRILPGDHFTPVKRPEEYLETVLNFLERRI